MLELWMQVWSLGLEYLKCTRNIRMLISDDTIAGLMMSHASALRFGNFEFEKLNDDNLFY